MTGEKLALLISDTERVNALTDELGQSILKHSVNDDEIEKYYQLENGANVRYIQALLGHKDLNTNEIYMRVASKKLKEVHQLTHPSAWH